MARRRRVWFPGATYHITARGNRRDSIFHDASDYQYYLDLIHRCQNEYSGFDIHAYCLMPNHIHLLLEAKNEPPGAIIQFIHTRYAIRFNQKYQCCGHLFQGRFHAGLILSNDYFLKASRYTHLNPVKAGIVSQAEYYRWSSYASFSHGAAENPILKTNRTLSLFENPTHHGYCTYVETNHEDDHNEDNPYHFNALTY